MLISSDIFKAPGYGHFQALAIYTFSLETCVKHQKLWVLWKTMDADLYGAEICEKKKTRIGLQSGMLLGAATEMAEMMHCI